MSLPSGTHQTNSNHAVPIGVAVDKAEVLSRLYQLGKTSRLQLERVQSIIPGHLLPHITAGPINGSEWCLLISNGAAAAKLRQLKPLLLHTLQQSGFEVTAIRLKIHLQPFSR